MTLLDNAAAAVELAMADFISKDKKRLLSCLRNLHAGILLLYKEKLLRLSPAGSDEVLLKQKIKPAIDARGDLVFLGAGKKTVDVAEIRERFASLYISTDWQRFDRVNSLRNDVEHYYSAISADAIRGAISDSFIVIRNFIADELGEDSLKVLGKGTWDEMLQLSEVFEAERRACTEKIDYLDWGSKILEAGVRTLECDKCGSPLLRPENGPLAPDLMCASCGHSRAFDSYVEEAVEAQCGGDNYESAKDGGDPASIKCPFCEKDAYIVAEARCACCGESCEHVCALCAGGIPVLELSDERFCSRCLHSMDKDD